MWWRDSAETCFMAILFNSLPEEFCLLFNTHDNTVINYFKTFAVQIYCARMNFKAKFIFIFHILEDFGWIYIKKYIITNVYLYSAKLKCINMETRQKLQKKDKN